MRIGRPLCYLIFGANALLVAACSGPQSALSPAGKEAERIAELFWWMTAAALVIWQGLTGRSPVGLPPVIEGGASTRIDLGPGRAAILQAAAAQANARFGRG